MPERDEGGHFMSDDDDGGRSSRGSGRYDDERDRDSRGRYTSSMTTTEGAVPVMKMTATVTAAPRLVHQQ